MEKRISFKLFVTVIWRGLCQALAYVGGLFGYKKGGSIAKLTWGIISLCLAFFMSVFTIAFICFLAETYVIDPVKKCFFTKIEPWCYDENLNNRLYYFNDYEGSSFVYDAETDKKLIKDVSWVMKSDDENDSLCVFAKDGKRGYINLNTSEVEIPADKYTKAWIFSEGLAAVVSDGMVKFIDAHNNVVIDNVTPVNRFSSSYLFNNGRCIVENSVDPSKKGVIDKTGAWVVSPVYESVTMVDNSWLVVKDGTTRLLSAKGEVLHDFGMLETDVSDNKIYVYSECNSVSCYAADGTLIGDNMIEAIEHMTYETGEIRYENERVVDDNGKITETDNSSVVKVVATARCLRYEGRLSRYGLMTPDGKILTAPLYESITAVGEDLYLCEDAYSIGVTLNGKGEIVK